MNQLLLIPIAGMNNNDILEAVVNGYRVPQPTNCPGTLYELMQDCWDRNPEDRPTFDYLTSFLKDYFVASEPNYKEPGTWYKQALGLLNLKKNQHFWDLITSLGILNKPMDELQTRVWHIVSKIHKVELN